MTSLSWERYIATYRCYLLEESVIGMNWITCDYEVLTYERTWPRSQRPLSGRGQMISAYFQLWALGVEPTTVRPMEPVVRRSALLLPPRLPLLYSKVLVVPIPLTSQRGIRRSYPRRGFHLSQLRSPHPHCPLSTLGIRSRCGGVIVSNGCMLRPRYRLGW